MQSHKANKFKPRQVLCENIDYSQHVHWPLQSTCTLACDWHHDSNGYHHHHHYLIPRPKRGLGIRPRNEEWSLGTRLHHHTQDNHHYLLQGGGSIQNCLDLYRVCKHRNEMFALTMKSLHSACLLEIRDVWSAVWAPDGKNHTGFS